MAAGTPGASLLLNPQGWDLMLAANNDIALATGDYALAQDAASAIKLFLGEYWFDTSQGIPYFQTTLGKLPPIQLIKAQAVNAAVSVRGVASAVCIIQSVTNRTVTGQVQITSTTGSITVAGFSV